MVIDTSALIAILRNEPEGDGFAAAIGDSVNRRMSTATLVEAHMVAMSGRGDDAASRELDDLIRVFGIEVVPVTEDQARSAIDAFRRYGKGRHPAKLNFGDCFAYALARATGEPLLYKGDDFARTDLMSQ